MNIKITARHMEVSDHLREYAEKKFARVEKYFHQLMDAHIIMYKDKLDHVAEIVINGDGVQFYGNEKSGDMYSSIDLLIDKMEKQVVKYKEKHSSHKAVPLGKTISMEVTGEGGLEINLNQVSHKPMDGTGAYLEMKLDGQDFIIFKQGVKEVKKDSLDYLSRNYALIYRDGDGHRMLEIPFDMIKENRYERKDFIAYDLVIKDDSPANPKIEFKKNDGTAVRMMTITEAIGELETKKTPFVPFFNTETNYFNVVYKKGNRFEVMVPAF